MKQPVVREQHRRLKEVFKTDNPQMMARVIRLCVLSTNPRDATAGAQGLVLAVSLLRSWRRQAIHPKVLDNLTRAAR